MYQGLRFPVLLILLLAFTFTACQNNKEIKGKEFIEREVFIDILVDIHLMDAVTQDRKFDRKLDVDSIDVLSPILEKYETTRHMFDTTLYVYSRTPELLDAVYNEVLIKLNVMLDEHSKEEEVSTQE